MDDAIIAFIFLLFLFIPKKSAHFETWGDTLTQQEKLIYKNNTGKSIYVTIKNTGPWSAQIRYIQNGVLTYKDIYAGKETEITLANNESVYGMSFFTSNIDVVIYSMK